MSEKRFIDVAAGLILTPERQLLLAQRPDDKMWSGWWELPGGKIEPGESPLQALIRELNEELAIKVTDATPWVTYTHEYPNTVVRLAFHRVTGWQGDPRGAEGQALAWTPIDGPRTVSPVLPATEPPLRWLRLPDRYLITSIETADGLTAFLKKLSDALASGIRLVQFREPAWAQRGGRPDQLYAAFRRVLELCRNHGAICLVNSAHPREWAEQADGIHYRATDAAEQSVTDLSRGDGRYVAMSAHDEDDLKIARQIGADFVVLGHVLDTPSHPGVPGMGWDRFSALNRQAGLPTFAIGGQSTATIEQARQLGAHGIAGIRMLTG